MSTETSPAQAEIVRVDRYTVTIDGLRVTATSEQERRIRDLDSDALARFRTLMGRRP